MPSRKPHSKHLVSTNEVNQLQEKLEAFMSQKLSPEELEVFKEIMTSGDLKMREVGEGFFKSPYYNLSDVAELIQSAMNEKTAKNAHDWIWKVWGYTS